ncbi:cell wall protein DAN4-like [Sparus aurata]|uniref:cell wall protein DAN4-like n=1 Tax=Sparus aurata TaxID=8175 RepID=UPI0011C0DE4C|nr:cell wall protein DAN4-like [Sparus aurata]
MVIPSGEKTMIPPPKTTTKLTMKTTSTSPSSSTGEKTTTPPPKTTTKPTLKTTSTSPSSSTAAPHLWQTVRLVIGGLYLIIMISITATSWTKARQEQKRCATLRENDI